MIREYNKKDIDDIIKLFNLHNELSQNEEKDKREELMKGKEVFVFDEQGEIKGMCSMTFWNNSELGSSLEVIMSILPGSCFYTIANSLWEKVLEKIELKNVVHLITHFNEKLDEWKVFFTEKKLTKWFGIHGMIYKGNKHKETQLTYRNYLDTDFDTYYPHLGLCFSEMRKAVDIRPFDVYKSTSQEKIESMKKSTLEMKDQIYMFYDKNQFIGSSIIQEEDIDDVFVVLDQQGKGYGRIIMEATLNIALEKKHEKITLGVVDWNKRAINLYKSLGFEIYRSFEHYRLLINRNFCK